MSATNISSLLAITFLIASAAHISAQDANAPLDVANVPASTGAFVLRDVDQLRSQSSATFGLPAHIGDLESGSSALSENAWDFTKPDSIPGFGALPPSYDSAPVMPQISGK
jgi:hypothetical protein